MRIKMLSLAGMFLCSIVLLNGCGEQVEHVDLPEGQPNEQLLEYAGNGNLAAVKFLIVKRKANPLHTDGKLNSALHHAAMKGHDDVILYLLQKNVPVDALNKYEMTPLQLAAMAGQSETVKLLQMRSPEKISVKTVLAAAIGGEQTLYALDDFCDLNMTDVDGNTAAHLAARNAKIPITAILSWKAVGGKINQPNKKGETPLILAINRPDAGIEIKALLQAGADPKVTMPDGSTLFSHFARSINGDKGTYEMGTMLLNKGVVPRKITAGQLELWLAHATGAKQTSESRPQAVEEARQERKEHMRASYSLPYRCTEGDWRARDFVMTLLNNLPPEEVGILNAKASDGTPLISKAISSELLSAMIAAGADASVLDPKMVFFSALYAGNPEVVKMMLKKGADVNWLDKSDTSTVVVALASFQSIDSPGIETALKALSIVEMLLADKKYEINRTNAYGHTVAVNLLQKEKQWEALFTTPQDRKRLHLKAAGALVGFSRCKYQANKKDMKLIGEMELLPEVRKWVSLCLWKDTMLTFLLRELTWSKEREIRGEEFDWEDELEQVLKLLDDKGTKIDVVNAQQETAADLFCMMTTMNDRFSPRGAAYLPSRNRQQLKQIGEKLAARGARPSARFYNAENEFTAPMFSSLPFLQSFLQEEQKIGISRLNPATILRSLPAEQLVNADQTTINGKLACHAVMLLKRDSSSHIPRSRFFEQSKILEEKGVKPSDADLRQLLVCINQQEVILTEDLNAFGDILLSLLKRYQPGANTAGPDGKTIWITTGQWLQKNFRKFRDRDILVLGVKISTAIRKCGLSPSSEDLKELQSSEYDAKIQASMGIPPIE